MADRFLIAPYDKNSGLQTNLRPWLIPDEAFSELKNAYVFRGRVRKRFGSRWIGDDPLGTRLRVSLGTTDGAGNINTFTPQSGGSPIVPPAIGQLFSIGTEVFTVNDLGNPADMLFSETATIATFDTTTGQVIITGADANTTLFYYPAEPVMGLLSYETNTINDPFIIAFDENFAYGYSGGWNRLAGEITPGASVWHGSDSQFFWGTTWTGTDGSQKVFFVTNFNKNEPNFMRQFSSNLWDNFEPQIDATPNYLISARIIVPFHNRLVVFNTWEGPNIVGVINYPNRARYSQVGSPLDTDAWRQDIPGRGNAIDASTTEQIVTVEFVKDRLIVFFESSTWELVYTGNQAYPFTWYQINTELGAEATFSVVPFDKVALGVGNVGIQACNGANVERIDNSIPDEVFEIHNLNQGVFRVYGIRDYFVEMVYWTFPDIDASADFPYPNRVLVYNYRNNTWGLNDDSITVFGYFNPVDNATWDSTTITWDDDVSWDGAPLEAQFKQVIAGNQEGYTFIIDADHPFNAAVLQITDVTATPQTQLVIVNHNLREGEYIYIFDAVWDDGSDGLNDQIFQVINVIDPDTIDIGPDAPFTGIYKGAGVALRVSKISIKTKEYNFYAKQGRNAYVSKVDFMVDATTIGTMQVDFFVSTSVDPLLQDAAGTGTLVGTGALDTFPYPSIPFEANAVRLWHPVYLQADGEVIQLQITMSDEQITTVIPNDDGTFTGPALEDFQMHAILIYTQPTSYRLQ